MGYSDRCEFSELLGKTLSKIETTGVGGEEIIFHVDDGSKYKMHHSQDWCEGVSIEDICGDLTGLIGSEILQAEESTNSDENPEDSKADIEFQDSFTWTFYRIATIKGSVVIRWYGESNGYYSEGVDFEKIPQTN